MNQEELKEKLTLLADCFYQERNDEGMEQIMEIAPFIGMVPQWKVFIDPLFDALEGEDYILAADIIQHELVEMKQQ
ncbi:MAG: hypothetical protein HFG34_11565 [Eubacterium sp.]|nr:hypothetical protein [Eubacterium sp.]